MRRRLNMYHRYHVRISERPNDHVPRPSDRRAGPPETQRSSYGLKKPRGFSTGMGHGVKPPRMRKQELPFLAVPIHCQALADPLLMFVM